MPEGVRWAPWEHLGRCLKVCDGDAARRPERLNVGVMGASLGNRKVEAQVMGALGQVPSNAGRGWLNVHAEVRGHSGAAWPRDRARVALQPAGRKRYSSKDRRDVGHPEECLVGLASLIAEASDEACAAALAWVGSACAAACAGIIYEGVQPRARSITGDAAAWARIIVLPGVWLAWVRGGVCGWHGCEG
eukprot:1146466-Pelagomonas_calceolata.AAC.10